MYKVTKEISFCYGHRLLHYDGPCRHLHGHNAVVELDLVGEFLDGDSVLIKFEKVEAMVENWINATLDHRMLLNKKDPLVAVLQKADEPVYTFDTNPTAEAIARAIFEQAKGQGLPVTEVRLWENKSSCAAYSKG